MFLPRSIIVSSITRIPSSSISFISICPFFSKSKSNLDDKNLLKLDWFVCSKNNEFICAKLPFSEWPIAEMNHKKCLNCLISGKASLNLIAASTKGLG